jgi:hypothetical protein
VPMRLHGCQMQRERKQLLLPSWGFVPQSVVPSFKPSDVGGSSTNGEAWFWQPSPALRLEPPWRQGVEC